MRRSRPIACFETRVLPPDNRRNARPPILLHPSPTTINSTFRYRLQIIIGFFNQVPYPFRYLRTQWGEISSSPEGNGLPVRGLMGQLHLQVSPADGHSDTPQTERSRRGGGVSSRCVSRLGLAARTHGKTRVAERQCFNVRHRRKRALQWARVKVCIEMACVPFGNGRDQVKAQAPHDAWRSSLNRGHFNFHEERALAGRLAHDTDAK